jgi:hypothetical protein
MHARPSRSQHHDHELSTRRSRKLCAAQTTASVAHDFTILMSWCPLRRDSALPCANSLIENKNSLIVFLGSLSSSAGVDAMDAVVEISPMPHLRPSCTSRHCRHRLLAVVQRHPKWCPRGGASSTRRSSLRKHPPSHVHCLCSSGEFKVITLICSVIKAIGNNEERKRNQSTETQDFNMENPLQQREVKTTGASQQNFTISGVCLQTPWAYLMMR